MRHTHEPRLMRDVDSSNEAEQLEFPTEPTDEKAAEVARERDELRSAVAANRLDTLHRQVAWILNHYPEARDSDIALQIHFWRIFDDVEAELGVTVRDLYDATRLTSLARARAKIQNTYKLFLASREVRKRRGKLSEEERNRALPDAPRSPALAVYADESGKEGKTLVVGSVWFLLPLDIPRFLAEVEAWKTEQQFSGELHFTDITKHTLDTYLTFASFLGQHSAVATFRCITAANTGHKHIDPVFEKMTYHLLMRGVEQEHATGRAPLPRSLIFTKDDSEAGRDQLTLSELQHRMELAAAVKFPNQLALGEFIASNSKDSTILQCADLYAGAVSRIVNYPGQNAAKDTFAHTLLRELGKGEAGPSDAEAVDGMAVMIAL
jgi:hypothetical protein